MSTATTTNLTIRIDKDLKSDAEELFNDLGLSISTAFSVFLKKCVREDRIPFEISRSHEFNKETIAALIEAEEISKHPENYKSYDNFEDLIAALESDDE